MTIYIAFIRGINVGGHHKIKMAELRESLVKIGLLDVKTYIQSGNIVFKSMEEKIILQKRIEHKIEIDYGFSCTVVLRTVDELEEIINHCPFPEKWIIAAKGASTAESQYVALCTDTLLEEDIKRLDTYKSDRERYHISGQDIYLLFYDSIRNSKLGNSLSKLSVSATVRNWKTLNKLASMAKEMQS
ncbi:DUF1697 domain-containing protein [Niallia nealsonii]|uniref:Cytoplasmic protein n=1 Tax=Niallia nealsonii TaxID=115979 RepID=A0A2N0YZV6_9BACI|nr:DUF1697 domain-containing protein [Niallia nealsonii]PKG22797.1 cytoplasmic protein [Niallia nealsonii]